MNIEIFDQNSTYLGTYNDQTGAIAPTNSAAAPVLMGIGSYLWDAQGGIPQNNGVAEYVIDTTYADSGQFSVIDYYLTPDMTNATVVNYQGNTPPATADANALLKTLTGQIYKYDANGANPVIYSGAASSNKLLIYGGIALLAVVALSGGKKS